jgi:ribosomal protein L19E
MYRKSSEKKKRSKRDFKKRQKDEGWGKFLGDLGRRLAFHEQRVRELRPLIADLEKAKADGMVFPGSSAIKADSATQN